MMLHIEMVDKSTGEILGRSTREYALNFDTRNDAGFIYLNRWLQSSVRGARLKKKDIQLRIDFEEPKDPGLLPFVNGDVTSELKKIISSYVG